MSDKIEGVCIEDIPIDIVENPHPNISLTEITTSENKSLDSDSEGNDSDELYDSDSDKEDEPSSSKKASKIGKKMGSKLTRHYKGLMGEANLRFARGDFETAQKMCFEVIRQIPNAYEPYLTLAQFYENSDISKYKSYLTIASYLHPSDASTWCRLAELNIAEGHNKAAIQFYSKAISADKFNIDLHMKRLALAEIKGDENMVLKFKTFLAQIVPAKDPERIIDLVSEVAKTYHKDKKYDLALKILKIPFQRIREHITQNLINMMLELLLLTGHYPDCLDIFVDFCNFKFEININTEGMITIDTYTMPDNIQVDLKTKFIVCVIKLKSFHLVDSLIDSLLIHEDVEIVGDLYLDICEALIAVEKPDIAIKLFVPLTKSKNFSLAGVWLKFSECLAACNMKEQAVEGYFTVITLAPQHIDVLYPLAMLLLDLNKKKEALEVMSYQSSEKIDVAILIERLKLLHQIGDSEEYWKCAELLLTRHCINLRNPEEIKVAAGYMRPSEKVARITKIRDFRRDNTEVMPYASFTCIREPSNEEEYLVFKDMLQIALEQKKYGILQKLVFMAMTSKRFEGYFEELCLLALMSCLYNGDAYHGYFLARDAVVRYRNNNLAWNLFNTLLQSSDDQRHNRFIERYQTKMPEHDGLELLDANYDILTANYNNAMKYFLKEFKEHKSPYVSFILGVIILQISCSRQITTENKKQLSETTTYLFLYYAKHRSKHAAQEVHYNLGRMYQQLGIMYLAEHYYKKVLSIENDLLDEHPNILCLKYEAAYNLHLLYKNSNNMVAARNVLLEHIAI